ncbi:MAG: DUF1641 domain-containing protein [Acidilobus sp.]
MSENDALKAAQVLGAALGSFVSSLLVGLPASLEELAKQSDQSGPSKELAEWALSASQEIAKVLKTRLPPEELDKIVEGLVVSVRGISEVTLELSKTLGDPRVAEIIRRTSDGFRKSLDLLSSYSDPMALLRAMSDPDIAFAVGVILSLLKALGVAVRVSSERALSGGAQGGEGKPSGTI